MYAGRLFRTTPPVRLWLPVHQHTFYTIMQGSKPAALHKGCVVRTMCYVVECWDTEHAYITRLQLPTPP
jgi:hypothetical protein